MKKKLLLMASLLLLCLGTFAQARKQELLRLQGWQAGSVVSVEAVSDYGIDRCFCAMKIPDEVFRRMIGKSFPEGCTVDRDGLRYVRVLHYDLKGNVRLGEMVCDRSIAADLVDIFRTLYEHRYPIGSIRLIDDFQADDELSMRANNTSAFCYRRIKGQKRLSMHALGRAIDLNPLYNPCVRQSRSGKTTVQPATATRYVDRKTHFPCRIDKDDLAYRLFVRHGFRWGGAWRSVKDYQHFEK